ncbi:flagellar basal body P-ring formation chaperone FlgA [Litorimonas sp.]|uniref:flagellar basal body P-ring formation chaperone FlgA n=1 Tax=Litorimonas sp. TaxID=1892381 RepID=UPI003A8971B7
MKQLVLGAIFGLLPIVVSPAFAATVTANSTLSRGTMISSGDISVDVDGAEASQDVLDQYVGKELIRTIYTGTEIRERDVQEPVLVKRNSPVTMIYRVGRLEISTNGRALSEGAMGEIVRVMNMDSRQAVEGRVTALGVVEMAK